MLVLLPLQWSWVLAAGYCEHEAASGTAHFGHHEHQHEAVQPVPEDAADGTEASGAHPDCGVCHLSSVPAAVGHTPSLLADTASAVGLHYAAHWPDTPPDTLFRPPLRER